MKTCLIKYFYFSLVIVACLTAPVYAQQEPDLSKYMLTEVDRAFELNQRAKYGESIEISSKVLVYANKVNDDYLKASAFNNLGASHYYMDNESESFDYLFKSKDLFLKLKDTSEIIIAYNNLGVNYRAYNKLEESNVYFKKSLNLAEISNAQAELVYPLYNMGVNLIEKEAPTPNDYKESYGYMKRAEVLAYEHYPKDAIVAEVLEVLSFLHHKLGDEEKSLEYYQKVLEYSEKYNFLEVRSEAYSNRADIYVEKEDFKSAFYVLEDYITTNDSINSMKQYEKAKQIEADNFIRENELKLTLVEKEKALQDRDIAKTRIFNGVLIFFTSALLLLAFFGYKKNKQLQKARDKAENLSREKSDFYSEISHELRTPLYAVTELSNLLLEEDVSPDHKEYLESLKFSGNHLLSLINNVLELNKVESGTMKIQLLDMDLKNIISNIIDSLEFALRDSSNTIRLDYDNSIPDLLVGDSLKLSQIFINLISNAIKFTNNGNITVSVRKEKDKGDEVRIYFEVSDTGVGISKEKQGQVFENFYQEHAKIEKSYKGTGLGLSIVKRMVTAMGGEVRIDSEQGKGSTFYFELCFKKSRKINVSSEQFSLQLNQLRDYKILVVDDNKINRLVTKRVLDQLKMESKVLDSGEKAIELVKIEHFDCILMDLHMPELDGYETTKRIREFNKEIAIVALTAASTDEVQVKIVEYELDGYILKPFITSEFIEVLSKAIKKDRVNLV
ncbi:ATP-binding protein [Lacinutrix himadriensis]|uniref:tetratricopeptide repeat-containing hybrid sensor histidine kinase/response regulator n=1 Tax=Lacinutrix himadriensis TaxID=641549 RepID=UPI0006E22F55|nr:ATP-binding protein [Lacinutrix himadriensis]